MVITHNGTLLNTSDREQAKRPYCPPALVVFGSVALLTRGAVGSCQDDGNNCVPGTGTMAMQNSDRHVKGDVVRIGTHPLGIGLYLFRYKPEYRDTWGHGRQFGVMADEVEAVMPAAILMDADGYKMVNYAMLGISRSYRQ